jgi:hypothetical protein
MVYVDCEFMVTACDPDSFVLERPGPETTQLFTCDELQEIVDCPPEETRVGFALIVAFGERTVIVGR